MSWYVYALCDPRIADPVLRVRYVGATKNYKQRLTTHIVNRRKHMHHMACWLRWLIDKQKVKPIQILLEEGPEDWSAGLWEPAEIKWIARYKQAGADLCNATAGGEGMKQVTPETRARMSAAQSNRSREVQERINASVKAAHARGAYAHIDYKKKTPAQIAASIASAAKWTLEQRKKGMERTIEAHQTPKEASDYILALRSIAHMNVSLYKPRRGAKWALATIANICQKASLGGKRNPSGRRKNILSQLVEPPEQPKQEAPQPAPTPEPVPPEHQP